MLPQGAMPTELRHMEPWHPRFKKSAESQAAWDIALKQVAELVAEKAALQKIVDEYLDGGGRIATAGEEITEYLQKVGLANPRIIHPSDVVPSPLNRSLDIAHMHDLMRSVWRDGFASNKCQNAQVHECVPGTFECEHPLGFRHPNLETQMAWWPNPTWNLASRRLVAVSRGIQPPLPMGGAISRESQPPNRPLPTGC